MDSRPPRKRSGRLVLTSLMAGTSLSMAACDSRDREVPAEAYTTREACIADGKLGAADCDKAIAEANKDWQVAGPRFADNATCEEIHGAGQCVPRSEAGSGSFFTPLLAGFVVGQMLNGGGYRGAALYRDRRDEERGGSGFVAGYGSGGSGGSLRRDYRSGGLTIPASAIDPPAAARMSPPRIQSRSSVISRGGFGGRGGFHGG